MRFRREEIKSFHATDYDFDSRTGTVFLRYAFEGDPVDAARADADRAGVRERITFEERIELGGALRLNHVQERAFERVVRLIHAAAGTSYYKAAAPPIVSIDSGPLTASELRFVEDLYDKGLREFAYKNDLPVPVALEVRAEHADAGDVAGGHAGEPDSGGLDSGGGSPPSGVCIPIGGGKDSIVVVEALRDMKPLLIGVNPAPASKRVADAASLELVSLQRTLDPLLFELNGAGALNGHVPITAVVSLIAVAAGYVHGYSTILMALEGSSDEATRLVGDVEINHQWSKSTECELELQSALADISAGIRYGSVLRHLSELEIGRCFAELSQYHRIFRSCNRAFSLSGAVDGWCNDCPKCRFVYLTLATSMGREELVGVFGTDLLGSADQVDGFRDLFDTERKPFECVGTRSESIAAFEELFRSPVWARSVVVEQMKSFLPEGRAVEPGSGSGSGEDVLQAVRRAADAIAYPSGKSSDGVDPVPASAVATDDICSG